MYQIDQSKPYQTDDEINLKELIINIFQSLRKNLILILLLVIIGGLIGFVGFKIIKPVYKTQMILSARTQLAHNCVFIINTWEDYISKNDYNSLANKTAINLENLKSINKINSEIKGEEDKESKTKSFIINIAVYNNTVLDSLENGIVGYLSNSATKNKIEKKKNLIAFKKRIDNEILNLDSVKLSLHNLILKGGNSNNPFLSDPGNINSDIVKLYDRSLEVEEEIQALDKINIVESFSHSDKPDGNNLLKLIVIGLVSGFVLSLVIIFFKSIMEN